MSIKLIKTTEAQKVLGVSKKKMSSLLAEGVISFREDPLDKRVKLIDAADIEKLRSFRKLQSA